MDWLKKVAPTIAAALAGPFAGLAVEAVGSAFGWQDATKEKIQQALTSGGLTGDQLLQLKQAELALQAKEQELGVRFVELDNADRDSARRREMTVKDSTNQILAFTVVGAFIAVVGATLLGYAKVESVLAGTLIGYLQSGTGSCLLLRFHEGLCRQDCCDGEDGGKEVKKLAWCDRVLIVAGLYYTVCTSPKYFKQALDYLGIPEADRPDFISKEQSNGTCWEFTRAGEKPCKVVCIRGWEGRDSIEVAGLLVHEAVHIFQGACEYINERNPSAEFEAYSIQTIAQELMVEFQRQVSA